MTFTLGQVLLAFQGAIYLVASVAYWMQGGKAMAVVMLSYGIANFALLNL